MFYLKSLLRSSGLLMATDRVRFLIYKALNYKRNKAFLKLNPGLNLPPDYLMYESFQLDYRKYYDDSRETAIWLKDHFKKHIELQNLAILDWGCGPGRIIRHLPDIINEGCSFYATDYNENTVDWCKKNIIGVTFNHNTLEAKLPYSDGYFDIVYGISIFTHLSEAMHLAWFRELYRILKHGGIMFLTTQGNNFRIKLGHDERKLFDEGKLIVRGNVKEGHRTFSAFQPPPFMLAMFEGMTVLEHIKPLSGKGKVPPQDIWIVRK